MTEKKWTRRILTVEIGGDGRPTKELQGREPWDLGLDDAEDEHKEDKHTLEESRYIVTVDKTGTVTGEERIKSPPEGRKVQVDRRQGIVTGED